MERLLNVMTVFSIALIMLVLISLRRAHIRVEYSMSWLATAIVLLILSRSHALLDELAVLLGIQDPPLALFLLLLGVLFLVSFRVSIILSRLKDANIALAQKVAVLEFEIRSLNEKHETTSTR